MSCTLQIQMNWRLKKPQPEKKWTPSNSTVITLFWRSYSLQKRPELLRYDTWISPLAKMWDWDTIPETLQALANMATTETQISRTVVSLENQRLHRDWKLAGILRKAAVSYSKLCCIFGTGPATEWTPEDFAPSHPQAPLARHSPH